MEKRSIHGVDWKIRPIYKSVTTPIEYYALLHFKLLKSLAEKLNNFNFWSCISPVQTGVDGSPTVHLFKFFC
jgi:hypothetical protein